MRPARKAISPAAPSPILDPPRRVRSKKPRLRSERLVFHDDGEGNWLVSYADMMTLLFGFFVIIATLSHPDVKKMSEFMEKTAKGMGGHVDHSFKDLADGLKNVLRDSKLVQEVAVQENLDGATLAIHGPLFFDSGSAELRPEATEVLAKIGQVLLAKAKDYHVIVEGHTDDVPIVSGQFPSNWELSAIRASTVVRLLEAQGLLHQNLRPMGLADTDPIAPITPGETEGDRDRKRSLNRRIVIRIQKQFPKQAGKD